MRLHALQFALAGGIITAVCFAWMTVATLLGIPGFISLTRLLLLSYGYYGYSITWGGVFVGAFWGFIEGFIWFGFFALIYNWLVKK